MNGHIIKDNQISDIVGAYNSVYNIKNRNNTEGSTPEFTMVMYLTSGLEIDIQDISKDYFIIDKVNKENFKSYCANSNNLYILMKEIQTKKLYQ